MRFQGRRYVDSIVELTGIDQQSQCTWNPLFEFDRDISIPGTDLTGKLVPTGNAPTFLFELVRMELSTQRQPQLDVW
ncbi:MAG: hypothetical protein R3C28_28570 [Pirellulaceae bacterium]